MMTYLMEELDLSNKSKALANKALKRASKMLGSIVRNKELYLNLTSWMMTRVIGILRITSMKRLLKRLERGWINSLKSLKVLVEMPTSFMEWSLVVSS